MAELIEMLFGLQTRGGPKKAQVQSYSPGSANVPSHENCPSVAAMWPYVELL